MKYLLGTVLFFAATVAQAKSMCANNVADIANIKTITDKVNLFGAWSGSHEGKLADAEFSKSTSGKFTGKITYDGKTYGPATIKLCDNSGVFTAYVFIYKADFSVISSKKIAIQLPVDGDPVVTMTKQSSRFDIVDDYLLEDIN